MLAYRGPGSPWATLLGLPRSWPGSHFSGRAQQMGKAKAMKHFENSICGSSKICHREVNRYPFPYAPTYLVSRPSLRRKELWEFSSNHIIIKTTAATTHFLNAEVSA